MSDDLVSRLSETLDVAERRANAATDGPWRYRPMKVWHDPPTPGNLNPIGEEFVGAGPLDAPVCVAATGPADDPQAMDDACHIARWHPQAVLRLVAAHRKILGHYAQAKLTVGHGDVPDADAGAFVALGAVVSMIADGWGVQDKED